MQLFLLLLLVTWYDLDLETKLFTAIVVCKNEYTCKTNSASMYGDGYSNW